MKKARIWSRLTLLAGLGSGCFLLLAPTDRDSLFLDSYQACFEEAFTFLLDSPGETSPAPDGARSELYLEEIALDADFARRHIVSRRADHGPHTLLEDHLAGREPREELLRRARAAIIRWNSSPPPQARFAAVHLPDRQPPPQAIQGHLLIHPAFAGAEHSGASACRLELEVRPPARPAPLYIGAEAGPRRWPTSVSLLPPLIAIALAVLLRRTIPALLGGVLLGTVLMQSGASSIPAIALGGARTFADTIIWQRVLTESFRLEIIGFVVFLCMAVGVMSRSGGIQGMVSRLSLLARAPRSTQAVSFLSGILIFFDDYANCIIIGNTMRPLTDRKRISREKLAYIVDSTAAPVAAISILSTWIAYEISMFAPELSQANPAWSATDGFSIFLQTIPFRFYCIFTLIFIAATIALRREFGPMLKAERRAWRRGEPIDPRSKPTVGREFTSVEMKTGAQARSRNAVLPIAALIATTLFMLWVTGRAGAGDGPWHERIRGILFAADSTHSILWGSAAALALASVLAIIQRILSPLEIALSALRSARALFFAVIILVLAWSIGEVCKSLDTASYLIAVTKDWIRPELLPSILFLTSCLVAFATGSSWSTMAILLPNVVVLAWLLGGRCDLGPHTLLVISIGAVLEGSIFGDHCSPISDTTVLSSVSTASNHLDHVKTQIPYAMTTMAVTLIIGYLPVAFLGAPPWLCLLVGIAVLLAILLLFGRNPADSSERIGSVPSDPVDTRQLPSS